MTGERSNEDDGRFAIMGEWLVERVDGCTCGTGGTGYGHEAGCGREPLGKVADLLRDDAALAAVRVEQDALAAENERLNNLVTALNDDADLALIVRDEAIEAESEIADRLEAERDAALARAAALQTAIEAALPFMLAAVEAHEAVDDVDDDTGAPFRCCIECDSDGPADGKWQCDPRRTIDALAAAVGAVPETRDETTRELSTLDVLERARGDADLMRPVPETPEKPRKEQN